MRILSHRASRFLVLLAAAALIGWGGLRLAPHSVAQGQTDTTKAALEAARTRLDEALAQKKGQRTKEAVAAVDEARAAYNAALAARVQRLRERVKELEGKLETSAVAGAAVAPYASQASGELQALRAELGALAPPAIAPLNPAVISETEPNDTPAQAQLLTVTSPISVQGAISPSGDNDYYKFTAPAGAKVWAYVDTGGTRSSSATTRDSLLTLFGTDGTTVIEEDDDDGTGNGCDGTIESDFASAIAGRTLTAAGTYYLRVRQSSNSGVIDPYTLYLVVTTTAPTPESEPNDTSAQANPIVTASSQVGLRSGAIGAAGDVDFYSVEAKVNDILYITGDGDPERDGTGTDIVLSLISPTGTTLITADESDDVGYPAPPAEAFCFKILTAGTYFVKVSHFSSTGTGTYHLMVAVAGQAATNCPTVTGINPTSGAVGSTVTITGTNLTGVTAVRFTNNVAATTFTVNSDTQITVTVPTGAVTGPISLTKPNCADVQTPSFLVPGTNCPTITGINPTSGAVGSRVAITGTNLSQVTGVKFGSLAANFTANSATLLTVTVPTGATTGAITVSRSDCPDVQTSAFTIITGPQAELKVDDGTFETGLGLGSGGTDYVVNRLTPTSYPATLSRVAIYFDSRSGLRTGQALTVLVGTNPSGGTNIDNTTFQMTAATIQALDQFNVFTVPAVTITSGDFLVGYSVTYAAGVFPHSLDLTPPSQQRSYISSNGTTFTLIDTVNASFAGNFGIRGRLAASVGALATVSAASFGTDIARDAIVAAFGAGLSTVTQSATSTPLPTSLGGTTVKVRDSTGAERLAQLFFVSPGQVNFLIPAGTAAGAATVIVTSSDGTVSTQNVTISAVAPSLFSINSSGTGLAAAVALRVKADNSQTFEPVVQFDTAQNKYVAVPIDLGPATDQVFLILFGTGIRGATTVTAKIGGVDATVSFFGPQGLAGLDQINVLIPRSLIGRGLVDVQITADGKPSNTVQVNIK